MGEKFKNLLIRVDSKIYEYQNFIDSAKNLKSNGLRVSLDELLKFETGDFPELLSLKYLFCFKKYLKEAPKGTEYIFMRELYAKSLSEIPEDFKASLIPYISKTYFKALSMELEEESIKNYNQWIDVYCFLQSQKIECQTFKDDLGSKLISKIDHFTKEHGIILKNFISSTNFANQADHKVFLNKFLECVDTVLVAKKYDINIGMIQSKLFDLIYSYLVTTYKISKLPQRGQSDEVKNLIEKFKLFGFQSESDMQRCKELEKYYCLVNDNKIVKNSDKQIIEVTKSKLSPIDINNMTHFGNIYKNNHHRFFVRIEKYFCSKYKDVAVKIYEMEKPDNMINQLINTEIKLLETFSGLSEPKNNFLKLYGSYRKDNEVYIYMEYHKMSLPDKINKMKKCNEKFDEKSLLIYTSELISSFAIIHEMKIYHLDIKPHNILFTKKSVLKIIDFSISEMKSDDQNNHAEKGMHFIKGTHGYMAPEIQGPVLNKQSKSIKIRYQRSKADVFSLGMVLLTMYNLEELHTLNYPENNQNLLDKVGEVRYDWLKTLLREMLKLNFKERPSFKECLKHLPGKNTTTCTGNLITGMRESISDKKLQVNKNSQNKIEKTKNIESSSVLKLRAINPEPAQEKVSKRERIYDLILKKVKIVSKQDKYKEVAIKLINKGDSMTLDQILQVDVYEQSVLVCFKYFLVFIKYLDESPKGLNYSCLCDHYIYAIKIIMTLPNLTNEVLPFITKNYLKALNKELETDNYLEVCKWMKVYFDLELQKIEIQAFENNILVKISTILLKNKYANVIKLCCEFIEIVINARESANKIKKFTGVLLNIFYSCLRETYNSKNYDYLNEKKLLQALELFKFDKYCFIIVENIQNFFSLKFFQSGKENKDKPKCENDAILNIKQYDFKGLLKKDKKIFAASYHHFFLSIYIMKYNSFINIAKSVYKRKDPTFNMNSIKKEINILEYLSKFQENSRIETCFLLYYGSKIKNDKISIYMQYIPTTLMDELKRMKKDGEKFEEEDLKILTSDLLSAFRLMNDLKIYHQNIKPHNILFTKDRKLKIINFSVSESRSYNESTVLSTGMINIQGTQGYMAPEIHKHLMSDRRYEKLQYSRGKAEVFSLGLTLLQMYTLESVDTLNFEENNDRLMHEVNKIRYQWLITLLEKMLHVDYKERCSFKECMYIVPQCNTTYKNLKTSNI